MGSGRPDNPQLRQGQFGRSGERSNDHRVHGNESGQMLGLSRRAGWFGLGALLGVAACSSASSGTFPNDGGGTSPSDASTESEQDDDASADGGGVRDAAAKDARAKDGQTKSDAASISSCEQEAACTGDARCNVNDDGVSYRHCSCNLNKLACGEIKAVAPTTCLQGGACTGSTSCSADDGVSVTQCDCNASKWDCTVLTTPDANCSVQNSMSFCSFPPQGKSRWLACFNRSFGSTVGTVCELHSGGFGSSGLLVPAACPAKPPKLGDTCTGGSSLYCTVEDPYTSGLCVGSCFGGNWHCQQ